MHFLIETHPIKQKSRVFYLRIPDLTRKSRVFSSQIPYLTPKSHVFSLRIPHLTRKSRVFSLRILHLNGKSCVFYSQIRHFGKHHAFSLCKSPILGNITRFLFENPPFMRETRNFSSRNPTEPENHTFSLQKYHI